MRFIRPLLLCLVVIATSLSGAMAAAHSDAAPQAMSMDPQMPMAAHPTECCETATSSAPNCHILPALAAQWQIDLPAPAKAQSVAAVRSTMLEGVILSGPLDPPRAV